MRARSHTLPPNRPRRTVLVALACWLLLGPALVAPPSQAQLATGALVPMTPVRLLDTRTGLGGVSGRVTPGSSISLRVAGTAGVPSSAVAVVLNVTATQGASAGFLTVWPDGAPEPTASVVNYEANQDVPGLVQIRPGAGGRVRISTPTPVHVVVDITAYYSPGNGGRYIPLPVDPSNILNAGSPKRVLDTRQSGPGARVPGRTAFVVDLSAALNDVTAVALNVTVTEPQANGFLTVFPGGAVPSTSNVNFRAGRDVANFVITGLSPDQRLTVFNGSDGPLHLIVDLVGIFAEDDPDFPDDLTGRFVPIDPSRILDTRFGIGRAGGAGAFGPGEVRTQTLAGFGSIPNARVVWAVAFNATVTDANARSFLTVWSDGRPRPDTSNINFSPGQTVANHAIVALPFSDNVLADVRNHDGRVHVIFDVAGFYIF